MPLYSTPTGRLFSASGVRTDSEVDDKVRAVIGASAAAASINGKKTDMNGEIDNQLARLTIANREKEAVADYIRDNLTSLDDFAEIQSAYTVFFCGVAGVNPMPLRQQQRYASQRIMQASLVTLIPHNWSPLSMHATGHRVVGGF